MISSMMRKRSSSSLTPSDLSATENYQAPDANDLAALLSQDKPGRRREVEFDSRESTPFILQLPQGVDHWKRAARAAREKLEKLFGKPEAEKIRQSISYSYYWQTEANHYADHWDLVTGKLSYRFDNLRPVTTDDIRGMISDRHYWETEAMHYERYPSGTNWKYLSIQKQEPRKTSSQRPSGIRKRKKALPSTLMVTSRDAPVSSRLRSRVWDKQRGQANEHLNGEDAR